MRVRRVAATVFLALGVVLTVTGIALVGTRITAATAVVREVGSDFGAAYFLGSSGGAGEVFAAIVPLVVVVLGIVVSAFAYPRVVAPGESVATARIGWHPLASREAIREAGRGRY